MGPVGYLGLEVGVCRALGFERMSELWLRLVVLTASSRPVVALV